MGLKDWFRKKFRPLHTRDYATPEMRERIIAEVIEICRMRRVEAEDFDSLVAADEIFEELIQVYEEKGLDSFEVFQAADRAFPENSRWLDTLAERALQSNATDSDTLSVLCRKVARTRKEEKLPFLMRVIECYQANEKEEKVRETVIQARELAQELLQTPQKDHSEVDYTFCQSVFDNLGEQLATIYLSENRRDEQALDLYRWVLIHDSSRSEYLKVIAEESVEQGRKDPGTLEILEQAFHLDPQNQALRRYLTQIYLDQNHITPNAIDIIESALMVEPDNRPLWLLLARHYLQNDMEEQGVDALRHLVSVDPPDPQVITLLLENFRAHPDQITSEDLDLLAPHIPNNSESKNWFEEMVGAFAKERNAGEIALRAYRLAVDLGIDRMRYLRLLARLAQEQSQWEESIQWLEKIREIEGDDVPDILDALTEAYLRLGRDDEQARGVFEVALLKGSKNQKAHERLCRHWFQENPTAPQALKFFRQTQEILPDCIWAKLGLLHHEIDQGRYEQSLDEGFRILESAPDNPDVRALLSRVIGESPSAVLLGRLNSLKGSVAREVLWLAHQENPQDKSIALAIARKELNGGRKNRPPRLIPVLRLAMEEEPENVELISGLSECLWRAGQDQEGAEVDMKILQWLPPPKNGSSTSSGPLDNRVKAARQAAIRLSGYYARNNITMPKAIETLLQAFDLGVCASEAIVFLARHLAATDNREARSEEILKHALQIQPNDTVLQIALFKVQITHGKPQEALNWCLEQLKASPARKVVRGLLRETLEHCTVSDLQSAQLGQLRGLCAIRPDDYELAEIVAFAHHVANEMIPQARPIFEKALKVNPDNLMFLLNLAQSWEDAGEFKEAIQCLNKALEVAPNNPSVLERQVRLFSKSSQYTKRAYDILSRALEINPHEPNFLLYKAEIELRQGKYEESIALLDKIARQFPTFSQDVLTVTQRHEKILKERQSGVALLVHLFAENGQPEEALKEIHTLQTHYGTPASDLVPFYETIIEKYPKNTQARVERAILYKVMGQFEESVADLEALMKQNDSTPNMLSELVESLELQLSKEKDPSAEKYLKLGELQTQLGDHLTAVKSYQRALTLDDNNATAHLALAKALVFRKDFDEALTHLRKCKPSLEVSECVRNVAFAFERANHLEKSVEALRTLVDSGFSSVEDGAHLLRVQERLHERERDQRAQTSFASLPAQVKQRYQFIENIAGGKDTGVVRAYDRNTDQVVALKIYPQGFASQGEAHRMFKERAELVRQLQHPNIINVFDAQFEGGRWRLAMDYLVGGSLWDKIRKRKRFSVPQTQTLALQLARAMAHAHSRDIIHGGLNPARVLLADDGTPKITGFLSSALNSPKNEDNTEPGTSHFSPILYICPEQLKGQEPNVCGDIYAYGCILFEAIAGVPPSALPRLERPGDTKIRLLSFVKHAGPVIAGLILTCIRQDPRKRYPSFKVILEVLKSVL